ncbi:MAG: methyltransferase domain-containing protein [Bacteroidales bacterium]|nr:methyltransferase domain-containing protein [Bacteroidales bacterium]
MKLFDNLEKKYCADNSSALESQRLAHFIASAPIVFQVSRLMVKFGILELIQKNKQGVDIPTIAKEIHLSVYAVKILLEASLSIGTVYLDGDNFRLTKTGWFLLNDKMVKANMNFNHDVNYLGMFSLEESLKNGKPEGLKVFGNWPTIYEGLSSLPEQVQKSWFGFDHFYSDNSFDEALQIVFGSGKVKTLLDVGGNTGRWAKRCVEYDEKVEVTIMDLPQQIEMMRKNLSGTQGAGRIHGHGANLLDASVPFPKRFDAIWMSQFLDCFSEEEITSILTRASQSMDCEATLYIMETFWDRQKYETAAFDLTMTSVYFTALANGNSKMYHTDDMTHCVERAGLKVTAIHDGIGLGHSIMECKIA